MYKAVGGLGHFAFQTQDIPNRLAVSSPGCQPRCHAKGGGPAPREVRRYCNLSPRFKHGLPGFFHHPSLPGLTTGDARAYLKPGCLVLSLGRMTEPVGQPGRLEPGENSRSAGQSSPFNIVLRHAEPPTMSHFKPCYRIGQFDTSPIVDLGHLGARRISAPLPTITVLGNGPGYPLP
ncbi:hypothetical protein CABS01_09467 [Colletotrichum abscissum]|uniref:uncharacterized protein n=1 Tax=Colletotrichum abscissum TaxID=1671311 RepID=UPI0027D76481|nr:uncharacterized protein CABS01_09467 [Colletotrichum abscissum]KAK1501736.1 hypothetical protein CABS01_09467 [Colletotrichum abscissum]